MKQSKIAVKALAFFTEVDAEFKRLYPRAKQLDDIIGFDSDYDEDRMLSMDYFRRIGLKK